MSPLAQRANELRLAVMMLTRLPVGRLQDPAPSLPDAQWAFPLVGLIVGAIAGATHGISLHIGAGSGMAAVLSLGAIVLTTGALHQDGLADFADGMWGGHDKARRLEIMRDSQIGSYGVLALILCCALWIAALAQLAGSIGVVGFLAVGVLSRLAMTGCLATMPAARDDGLGAAAKGKPVWALYLLFGLGTLFALGSNGLPVVATVGIVTLIVGQIARRRIGGQTGDVLGAVQFISETAAWTILALLV
ncbi:adenosylcobinamide-GDP ribazoletransferase [Lentibacter sp. XHP0401]|nr:adenosylcobinamide-GDP ribazoletransferase [Lentibacter sp. XHP0401]